MQRPSVRQAEKITQRRFHAGNGIVVPVHANDEIAQIQRVAVGHGQPNMADDSTAVDIHQRNHIALHDAASTGCALAAAFGHTALARFAGGIFLRDSPAHHAVGNNGYIVHQRGRGENPRR